MTTTTTQTRKEESLIEKFKDKIRGIHLGYVTEDSADLLSYGQDALYVAYEMIEEGVPMVEIPDPTSENITDCFSAFMDILSDYIDDCDIVHDAEEIYRLRSGFEHILTKNQRLSHLVDMISEKIDLFVHVQRPAFVPESHYWWDQNDIHDEEKEEMITARE